MKSALLLSFAVVSTLAVPVEERQLFQPTASVSSGKVVGRSALGVDTFNGIPFAKPPVGPLRLKPPQPYTGQFPGGSFDATATAKSCPQGLGSSGGQDVSLLPSNVTKLLAPLQDATSGSSEDCLTLNVQRPSGVKAGAKLPVLFWIYGGAFAVGSSSMYDGSQVVSSSVALAHPVIFVAVNYRLGAFGYLAGKEVQRDGSTNLGLRDQRLGLQWVADNIDAFGGDPSKVTIWGESAGAISVNEHTLINNGDHTYKGKPLFRAGISNSGTVTPADPVDTGKAQNVYNSVVAAAGCSGAADTLACLRTVPFDTFQKAANSVPGLFSYRAVDIAYIPRPDPSSSFFPTSPEIAVKNGKFAKVPIIAGDQEDEGTLFSQSQSNITTTDQLVKYLQSYFPVNGADLMPSYVATYPDDPTAGSPFRTGPLNNVYPQYKRLAAILGDLTFTLVRRAYLTFVSKDVPTWSYLDTHLYGTPVLGTFHGNDILSIFSGLAAPNVVKTYRSAVISFTYYQDPNKIVDLKWPQWTTSSPQLLNIDNLANKLIPDNFRSASYNILISTLGRIRI